MRSTQLLQLSAFIALISLGCSEAVPSGSPSDPESTGVSATTSASAPAPVAATAEQLVGKALEEWVAAQNGGDFKTYRALYATTLLGIKRSGSRVHRLDRKGWLADREQMFRRPMTVTADGVSLKRIGGTIVVEFAQRWQSKAYEDYGAKRLTFVEENGNWRIRREEMLESTELPSQNEREGYAVERFAFVLHVDETPYLILRTGVAEEWAEGVGSMVSRSDYEYAAERAVSAKLPSRYRSFDGQAVRLYGPGGACNARVEALQILGYVLGDVDALTDYPEQERVSDEVLADRILSYAGRLLVARIDQPCDGALWGQLAESPEPRILDDLTSHDSSRGALDRARKAFEKEPEYGLAETAWRLMMAGEGGTEVPWTHGKLRRKAWGTNGTVDVVTVSAPDEGCGNGIGHSLFTTYRTRKRRPALRHKDGFSGHWAEMVIDLDGDGRFEIVATDGFAERLIAGRNRPQPVLEFAPERLGCRC